MTLFAPINDNSIIKETNRFTTSWSRWFQEVTKILTGNQAIQLTSYLVADLPPATTEGQIIYVSNATGGSIPAFSDGVDWRRVDTRAIVT